jgi:hypothetical protein
VFSQITFIFILIASFSSFAMSNQRQRIEGFINNGDASGLKDYISSSVGFESEDHQYATKFIINDFIKRNDACGLKDYIRKHVGDGSKNYIYAKHFIKAELSKNKMESMPINIVIAKRNNEHRWEILGTWKVFQHAEGIIISNNEGVEQYIHPRVEFKSDDISCDGNGKVRLNDLPLAENIWPLPTPLEQDLYPKYAQRISSDEAIWQIIGRGSVSVHVEANGVIHLDGDVTIYGVEDDSSNNICSVLGLPVADEHRYKGQVNMNIDCKLTGTGTLTLVNEYPETTEMYFENTKIPDRAKFSKDGDKIIVTNLQ